MGGGCRGAGEDWRIDRAAWLGMHTGCIPTLMHGALQVATQSWVVRSQKKTAPLPVAVAMRWPLTSKDRTWLSMSAYMVLG